MSGPKRAPDKLNTIGVVVVGICGAVLVYVTILALQAFYVGDTSEIQTMADYGGQDKPAKNARASQSLSLTAPSQPNPRPANTPQTFHVPLQGAITKLIDSATSGGPCGDNDTCADPNLECRVKPGLDSSKPQNKVCVDVGHLVPLARSDKPTIQPAFGRPKPLQPAGTPAPQTPPTSPPGKEPGPNGTGAEIPKTDTGGQGPGGGPVTADKSHPATPPPTTDQGPVDRKPAQPDKKPAQPEKKPAQPEKKPEGQPKK
jgi:hypothetical protein